MSQTVFRSDTRAVEVTVVATRGDGSIVNDLRKDEIRVFDNNREQAIASFEKMGEKGAAGIARTLDAAVGASPRSRAIILIDALNTRCGDQIYGRESVTQVLGKLPEGRDRIAIFALGDELHLLIDFSTDAASLHEAMDDYEGERPAIGVDLDHPEKPFECRGDAAMEPPQPDAFKRELRLSRTLEALTTIATRMKSFPGEKSLLWVTGGFAPPPEHQEMELVMRELEAAKVRLYPIDARGLPVGRYAYVNIGTLQELAEPTGGQSYFYDNDVAASVFAALDRSHEGYVLTFSPKEYREDGSFHDLRLKTIRKGVGLSYRTGYVAKGP